MFSPAAKSSYLAPRRDRTGGVAADNFPSSPLGDDPATFSSRHSVPDRPATGTSVPWSSRLSVLSRMPSTKGAKGTPRGDNPNQIQPVHSGEFPQVVRHAQATLIQKNVGGSLMIAGGMDKGTSLSWIICGNQLFIWSCLSTSVSKSCVVLEIPSSVILYGDKCSSQNKHSNSWLVCFVEWTSQSTKTGKGLGTCNSVGVIVCDMRSRTLVYWPEVHPESSAAPVVDFPSSLESSNGGEYMPFSNHEVQSLAENTPNHGFFTSLIAAEVTDVSRECLGIACQSNGELWHFRFTTSSIYREKICQNALSSSLSSFQMNKVYARSLVWRLEPGISRESGRQFFLLTDNEVQCWSVMFSSNFSISRLWSHEIVGSDGDSGIKKDLAGQKHVWLLDMQVDARGKEVTILVATLCKDRVSSSSYTQYSILTMQYKPGSTYSSVETGGLPNGRFLEKKVPLQIVIPKARVEDEESLFLMRLRIGGKPSGSVIILSGDGTATVASYWRGSMRLYQFDLPWDAGKVLDASVFPSTQDNEEGAWVVLTEKAGVWAIPEKAVLLGGVEPPERSLSRNGSSNEGAAEEEKRSLAFGGNIFPRRTSSEAWGSGERQRSALSGIAQRTAQDEEAEALLARLFHDFLLTSQVEGAVDKLRIKGAFEKEGETNIFARVSKSIVDTLAKHWTAARGPELVAHMAVSSFLTDKQQKHTKFLQFIALSKCHEVLASRQRQALLTIMEHGEKLSAMIQLRELQNIHSQNRLSEAGSPGSHTRNQIAGSLWGLIQLVGKNARRNNVLLMDRDNAEIFYSTVSEIEESFSSLNGNLQSIISGDQPLQLQFQQAYEVCNAITTSIQSAMHFRDEHQTWYPSPEGLTPWNCQPVVRSGLWNIASFILLLLNKAALIEPSAKMELSAQMEVLTEVLLEAYSSAIIAKKERGEEHKGLVEEYFGRRDMLLSALYEQAKGVADAKYQESHRGIDDLELKRSILRDVSSSLLTIAKCHEGYQTLWQICFDLSDTVLLRGLMHDSRGPRGGFCDFVFNQLIKSCRYSKLLRLGEEFQEELASFLKEHTDLLWLHELFLNQFSSASETLYALALPQEYGSVHLKEENSVSSWITSTATLKDRKRLLILSKIAGMAGKAPGFDLKLKRIEADLRILELQDEIARSCASEEGQGLAKLCSPTELIEVCFKERTRELALQALEVFAWTSSSFRISNRSLLKECWRNVADQDDWLTLSQLSLTEGWSDEVRTEHLRETLLFKAACGCYGPEAERYDGGFDEAMPLQGEDAEFDARDRASSLEGVLMQHPAFPDAGKLMLAAVMLGKLGSRAPQS